MIEGVGIAVLEECDRAADVAARLARKGRPFDLLDVDALREGTSYTVGDLLLITWAAGLGYREGQEVIS